MGIAVFGHVWDFCTTPCFATRSLSIGGGFAPAGVRRARTSFIIWTNSSRVIVLSVRTRRRRRCPSGVSTTTSRSVPAVAKSINSTRAMPPASPKATFVS